jgi:DNA-binding transcriptional ArsR family regulator
VVSQREPLKMSGARHRVNMVDAHDALAYVQQVLCEPARLRIVAALDGADLTVSELAAVIGRKVPATSQHLRLLRQLEIVEGERHGTTVRYRLRSGEATDQIRAVLGTLGHDHDVAS